MRLDGVPPFEFLSTLNQWFPQYDKTFFVDIQHCWYHKGLHALSTNIEETKTYLETLFRPYQKVVIMGNSAGGYAAILFGSLLKVAHVIAFVPQTILTRSDTDVHYRNLREFIHPTTRYHLYGDTSVSDPEDHHHISHVENLRSFPNVTIVSKNGMSVRDMRDQGELFPILQAVPSPSNGILNTTKIHPR